MNLKTSPYKLIREAQGLSLPQVRRATGIPTWILKDFEGGILELKSDDLEKLRELYSKRMGLSLDQFQLLIESRGDPSFRVSDLELRPFNSVYIPWKRLDLSKPKESRK